LLCCRHSELTLHTIVGNVRYQRPWVIIRHE
jgi:hypothetical protein